MTSKEKYAKALVEIGVNVQKGQTLVLSSPVECADFARLCAKFAYERGCREVVMNWSDDNLSRQRFLYAENDVFDKAPEYKKVFTDGYSKEGAAFLHIYARDPEALSGVDSDRIRRNQISSMEAMKTYRLLQSANELQWCIASVPIPSWAKKVFPDKSEDEAMALLWDAILKTVFVNERDDVVALWNEHIDKTDKRAKILTDYNFKYLKYKNSLGTDLTVELADNHRWAGGCETMTSGVRCCVNMPSYEVFTCPKKYGTNGVVYSSLPLELSGSLVENFMFRIDNGKIVEVKAKKNEAILLDATKLDEGASFLGEVALISYDSPISNLGILFYNTLFDENASCHIAFGEAIPCFTDTASVKNEEYEARGINDSNTHIDFMIGTKDLSVTGITQDNEEIPIFVDGNFVF